MWLSVVEALDPMSVQAASKLAVPALRLYCHLLIVPLPVTDEVTVSLPLPDLAATGLSGWPGLVRKSSLASSVEQPLSLYAL